MSWSKPALRWGLVGLLLMQGIGPIASIQPVWAQSVEDAYSLLNQGLVNQAIPIFQQSLRNNPRSLNAQLGLALAYQKAGRIEDAFTAFQQVLTIDPQNRIALTNLGTLGGYRIEWQDNGITALTTLLELEPNNLPARTQRALLYGYQGRFVAAIADYEIVLANQPSLEAVGGAAQVYAYNGDYQRSLQLFDRYQAGGGRIRAGAATAYAVALRETGNAEQAVRILAPEVTTSDLNGTTIRQLAELAVDYAATGRLDQAIQTLMPLQGRPDSRMILARSLMAIGRYSGDDRYTDQAIPLFQNVLTQERDYLTVAIGREIADVLSGFPQVEARAYALEVYRQLLQQQPSDRSLQIAVAVSESELGQLSEVALRDQLEVSLRPLPADRYQQSVIAKSLLRLESPDPSLLPYYEYLANQVNQPRLYYRIAQMQVEQENYAAAETALTAYNRNSEDEFAPFLSELLRAEADRRQGNLEASANRYEAILANSPADDDLINSTLQGLAGIRQTQGRLPEAVAIYDQLIARNPQDAARPLGRTSLAYRAGLISEAEAEAVLNRWQSTQPATATPLELYSLVAALPASAERESLYMALLRSNPNDTGVQVRYVQVLAARDPAAAEAYVEQLIARDPDNPNVYFVQGQLASDRGNLQQAGRAYQALLERNPNQLDALSALGGIRFQQRRYDTATQLYNQVLALDPNNRVAQMAVVDLKVVEGRRLDALNQLEDLQVQQARSGRLDPALVEQQQRIEEGFLQQRGFQPPWERY